MNTNEYIDAIKEKYNLNSDYKVGKLLDIGRSRIANYRAGNSYLNDELAIKIAHSLDKPLGEVLLDIHIERAKDDELRQAWLDLSKKISGIAAGVFLATSVQIAQDESSNNLKISDLNAVSIASCILC